MTKTLVVARVFPPAIGGSGQWMYGLYSRMPPGEYVIAAGESEDGESFDRTHQLPIYRLPLDLKSWGAVGWRSSSDYLGIYRRLRKIQSLEQISRVHAACVLPEGLLAWMLSRRQEMPYLVYVHGEELNVLRKSRELTWLARRVFGGAAIIVANSHNTAGLLSDGWNAAADRIRVMHPGIDTREFCPASRNQEARRRLRWGDRPVVLCVGRLQRRKGQDLLIRCLPRVRERIPDVLCAIVGDGEDAELLEQLVQQHGLRENVAFHGQLAGYELRQAYQQCDVFALPNREVGGDIEGFGIVLLEAQACGKPVIAGNSGGTRETIRPGETGELVDSVAPDELSTKLVRLLMDDERRRSMGVAARAWTVEHFSWQFGVDAARQVFSELVSPTRAHAHDDLQLLAARIEVSHG